MELAGRLALYVDGKSGAGMKLQQLKQIASVWLQEELDKAFICKAQHVTYDSPDQVKQEQDLCLSMAGDWNNALNSGSFGEAWPLVMAMEQRYSMSLDKADRRTLAGLLCLAHRELYERQGKGKWPSLLDTVPGNSGAAQEVVCGKLLSEVFAEFSEQKTNSGEWSTTNTAGEYQAAFRAMAEIVGDIPINELDKAAGREFAKGLLAYPKNRASGKLKGRPLAELSADKDVAKLSGRRVNNLFVSVSGFINWAKQQDYISTNPLAGLNPTGKKAKDSDRLPFDSADIRLLFSTPIYTKGKFRSSRNYWIPLFALYTGARQNELCQLDVDNVEVSEEQPRYVIHIRNEAASKQSVKNKASIRRVPVHAHLLELGFVEYLESRPKDGKLFDVSYFEGKGKWSHDIQRWFSSYKKDLGFGADKVFHSFRHTMRDALVDAGGENPKVQAILGHEQSDTTNAIYGTGFKPKQLNEVIQRISWREELAEVMPWGEYLSNK